MDKNYDAISSVSNTFIFKRPTVVNFADIIKIATMFIKAALKEKKVKRIRIMS